MVCFQEKISSYEILLMISRSNKSSRKSISLYRTKRILIVDDDSDVALTFKKPLKKKIEIVTTRLRSKLKHTIILFRLFRSLIQTFYDLMFIDIHQILDLNANPRVCFMSSGPINQEALREKYPSLRIGFFISKPVTIENLVRNVKAELDQTVINNQAVVSSNTYYGCILLQQNC